MHLDILKLKDTRICTQSFMLALTSTLAWIVPAGRWINFEHCDLILVIQAYVFNYWSILNTKSDL